MKNYGRLLSIGALVLVLDQLTKAIVVGLFPVHFNRVIVPGFFNLVHARNTGIAFSLFAGGQGQWRRWFFVAISLIAVAVILLIYRQTYSRDKRSRIGLGLILGGALGNLVDRLRFGEVVDFLDFHVGAIHWPAFNVADAAISIGALLLLWALLKPSLSRPM